MLAGTGPTAEITSGLLGDIDQIEVLLVYASLPCGVAKLPTGIGI
jgi:hypothetical protein